MTLIEQLGILAERGIIVQMISRSKFIVDGFYKSGTVCVDIDECTITARYDEVSSIYNNDLIQTLVDINYDWWLRSKDRYDGWKNPDSLWIKLLMEYGLIHEEKKTVVNYC